MKINKKNKMRKSLLIAGILVIMLGSFISAFGVISPYTGTNVPLELSPGQEKTFDVTLRNSDVKGGLEVEIKILQGMEIASLKKSSLSIPYEQEASVGMIIKIPTEAKIGDGYNVVYESKQIPTESGNGTLGFTQTIIRNFIVNIVPEKPVEPTPVAPKGISTTTIIVLIIAIIIIIAIILFLVKRKK